MATPPSAQAAGTPSRPRPGVRHPGAVWLLAIASALAGALAPTPWWQLGIIAGALAACAAFGRLRSPALRFGLVAACVFVAVRVAYRIVFTSTVAPPEGAALLIDLPVIPLGGPFRGIALLGPLSLGQLLATLADASRFAAVFVIFGAANAIADARTLLARAPRPVLPLATVLALALGAVPAFLASLQRVDRAARLRGERRGPRLLVPVLEQAVERATTLGASMELRGFGSAPRPLPPPDGRGAGEVLLRARGLTVRHGAGTRARVALSDAEVELRAGSLTLVTGPTGSGKSTLLRALAGLAPAYTGGEIGGSLEVLGETVLEHGSPRDRLRPARLAGLVALVPQRVEHSFLAATVRAELAFAPARRGLSGAALEEAVDLGLERFGLVRLADRDPASLSAGEATRAALAAACLVRPRVLLLDEPIADLDPGSVEAVLAALRTLLAEGCAVLVAEHRPKPLAALEGEAPIRRFEMRDGVLREGSGEERGAEGFTLPSRADRRSGEPIVLARDLAVERGGRVLLRVDELAVLPGSVTVLAGPNGSGKTSLLESVALPRGSKRRAPGVVLVPHRIDDLLIRDTVAAECRFADRRAGAAPGATAGRFAELLAGSLDEGTRAAAADIHPRDLSAGTRLALGIAVQLAHEPRVLLLDEPTRGLDARARRRLAAMLAALAGRGAAVLLATHDAGFAGLLGEEGAPLRALRLVGAGAAGAGPGFDGTAPESALVEVAPAELGVAPPHGDRGSA